MFPDGLDPIIMSSVKPMFVRGEYDTAVFRAFKEVEVRVRNKDPSLAGESRVDLMYRATDEGRRRQEREGGDARLVRRSILDLPEPVGASRGQV
jgi:hypothetical protein